MKKLRKQTGETIVEALVSVLIAALCFVALQVSVVSATNINKKAEEENTPFHFSDASEEFIRVNIIRNGTSYALPFTSYKGYKVNGDYYYYDYQR